MEKNNEFFFNDIDSAEMLRSSSSSSPPRQRVRLNRFVWDRFVNAETATTYKKLRVTERPSVALVRMMLEMNGDDQDVARNRGALERYAEYVRGGENKIEYEQKSYDNVEVNGYHGVRKIGRAYTKCFSQQMPSKLLNTMYKGTHVELDIRSSYSTMLYQAFKHLEIPAMRAYVESPDDVYDGMRRHYNLKKDQTKKLINGMICGYPDIPSDYGLGFGDMDLIRDVGECSFVDALKLDLGKIKGALELEYPGFYAFCDKYAKMKSDTTGDHTAGVAMSFMAADMEQSVMRHVIKKLYGDDVKDTVWRFDGILIHQSLIGSSSWGDFEETMTEYIQDKMGIEVQFKTKSLAENSLGISLSPQELGDKIGYGAWKSNFEKRFFRLSNPPVFCQVLNNGSILDLNESQFKHNTSEMHPEYIKAWRSDIDKRMYECKDFAPPPCTPLRDSFNMYRGLEAELWPANDREVSIDPYLRHVDVLMGNVNRDKDHLSAYFHKLIAQKIQKPGQKWRVMPFIRSTQGVGKDLWADFMSKIFGFDYVHKACAVGDVMGKSSAHQEGRLLVIFSEMSYGDTSIHMEELKNAITSEYVVVKKKYVNEYKIRQTADFIGFSNNFGAIQVDQGERRLFVVTASGLFANDHDYFAPLLEWMDQQENQRAVYDYYMAIDVEGFDSSAERPITEDHKEMASSNRTTLDMFLSKAIKMWKGFASYDHDGVYKYSDCGILRVTTNVFLNDFCAYAQELKINKAENKSSMMHFVSRQVKELNAKTEKYLQPGSKTLIYDYKSHGIRYKVIDYIAWERYKNSWSDDAQEDGENGQGADDEEDGVEEVPSPTPIPSRKTAHWNKKKNTRFVVKMDNERVYFTDDFDDLNRELGEAYIEKRGGEYVLVNPHTKREYVLDEYFTKDPQYMRQKVEARYPWYVVDRTNGSF